MYLLTYIVYVYVFECMFVYYVYMHVCVCLVLVQYVKRSCYVMQLILFYIGSFEQNACIYSPGRSSQVINVGATAMENGADIVYKSNYGSCVTLYAPGVNRYIHSYIYMLAIMQPGMYNQIREMAHLAINIQLAT